MNTNSREGTSSLLDVVMLRPEGSDGDDEGEGEAIHPMGSGPLADEQIYCTCKRISFGEMIACDNTGCPFEWVRLIMSSYHDDNANTCLDVTQFHLSCVGITKPSPNEKWYCERCREGVTHDTSVNPASNGAKPGRGGRGRGKGGSGVKRGRTVK
jgi:chromatin modification-related protein YNG2